MQLSIRKTGGLPYARKEAYEYDNKQYEADIKNGDIIKFLDGGEKEVGNFGEQNNFKIKTRNGDKKISLNQMSQNILVLEFGGDTEKWIGKEIKVLLKKAVVAGRKCIIAYYVVEGYSLDEYGELCKDQNMKSVKTIANETIASINAQTKNDVPLPPDTEDTSQEIRAEDIPF